MTHTPEFQPADERKLETGSVKFDTSSHFRTLPRDMPRHRISLNLTEADVRRIVREELERWERHRQEAESEFVAEHRRRILERVKPETSDGKLVSELKTMMRDALKKPGERCQVCLAPFGTPHAPTCQRDEAA